MLQNVLLILGLLSFMKPDEAYKYPGAGVILYKNNSILLVQSMFTGKWSFTKGTHEASDTSFRKNAVREVWEEAGFLENHDYTITGGPCIYGERPYWFGTMIKDKEPVLNMNEHQDIHWFYFQDMHRLRKTNNDVKDWKKKGMPFGCLLQNVDEIDEVA